MQLSITQLKQLLTTMCVDSNLAFDNNNNPVKIGPDCYMFYATELSSSCRKEGQCSENTYYVLTGGDTIKLLNSNNEPL